MKLTPEIIESISQSVESGLSTTDAAAENNISRETFYAWLRKADDTADRQPSKLTQHQKLCRQFKKAIHKAKMKRKKRWISFLETCKSPAGVIFLLKMTYPGEFNKQPIQVPNFSALEDFMRGEYTQLEIEAIRQAVHAAEARRQSEVRYDENELFGE